MILFYVSGHGFGHATRAVALLRALRAQRPGLKVAVVSDAPSWIFTDAIPGISCFKANVDPGMIQLNGLDIDLPRSLAAHERFVARWKRSVEVERRRLSRLKPALVVGDIPPLAFAAAAAAGVPSVGIANFSWDWILSRYSARQPRWKPIVQQYATAYGQAGELFRLPLSPNAFSAFRKVTNVPLLVNRRRIKKKEMRRMLGIAAADRRPLILITFGGFGSGPLRAGQGDAMPDFLFAGFGPKPGGLNADWISLPRRLKFPHVNVLAACDAVIGKPGYGTFAEVLAQRRPLLYLPRQQFAESPVLAEWINRHGVARPISRGRFYSGRWRPDLEALLSQKDSWSDLPLNGAEVIAARLARFANI